MYTQLSDSDSHACLMHGCSFVQSLVQTVALSDNTGTFQESERKTEGRTDGAKCFKEGTEGEIKWAR